MATINRKAVKKLAVKQTSDGASWKEIFLFTLVRLAVLVVLLILNQVLDQGISGTGGLSGMGRRSVLETIRTVLQYANMFLAPFWDIGILYWAISRARGRETRFSTFAEGFRRFGPVFRLLLIQGLVLGTIYFICIFASSILFAFSPLAFPLMKFMLPYMEDPAAMEAVMVDTEFISQMLQYMWPVYIILALLLIPAVMPLYYRFRMATYIVMDKPHTGAVYALIRSFQITKQQFKSLFLLDLSYWWYFALEIFAGLLSCLFLLLPIMGIPTADPNTLILISYLAGYLVQLSAHTLFRGRVETAYALVYNACNASVPEPKLPAPQRPSWNEE